MISEHIDTRRALGGSKCYVCSQYVTVRGDRHFFQHKHPHGTGWCAGGLQRCYDEPMPWPEIHRLERQ